MGKKNMITVAVFTDTFNEISGVATIYQNLLKLDSKIISFDVYYGENSDSSVVYKLDLCYSKKMFLQIFSK